MPVRLFNMCDSTYNRTLKYLKKKNKTCTSLLVDKQTTGGTVQPKELDRHLVANSIIGYGVHLRGYMRFVSVYFCSELIGGSDGVPVFKEGCCKY